MKHHHGHHHDEHGRHAPAQSKVAKRMRGEHEGVMRKKEERVFHEAAKGELHSGSKHGPIVKKRKQIIAIAMHEGRKAAHGGYKKHHRRHK